LYFLCRPHQFQTRSYLDPARAKENLFKDETDFGDDVITNFRSRRLKWFFIYINDWKAEAVFLVVCDLSMNEL
jgi:hypothetical protein